MPVPRSFFLCALCMLTCFLSALTLSYGSARAADTILEADSVGAISAYPPDANVATASPTFLVSPSGSDSNTGTRAAPFLTMVRGSEAVPAVANVWVGSQGSCTRSSVPVPYGAATSCATFDAAYHAATPGDTADVTCGSYPGQSFTADASKTSGTVILQPASNGCVTITDPGWGFNLGPTGVSYLTLKDFTIIAPGGGLHDAVDFHQYMSRYITFDGNRVNVGQKVNGCCGVLAGVTDHWKIINNTFGPWCCGTTNASSPEAIRLTTGNIGSHQNTNALIDNNLIQYVSRSCTYWPATGYGSCPDTTCTASGCHMDGIHAWGLQDSTISRNRIYNAEVQGIFLEQAGDSLNKNVTIVNNAVSVDGGSAGIYVKGNGSNSTAGTWTIAFNTVNGNVDIPGAGVTGVAAGTVFNLVGNIGRLMVQNATGNNSGCQGFANGETINYSYNLWAPTNGGTPGPCSVTDRGNVIALFANPAVAPTVGTDLHLASGNQTADNFIPSAICASIITDDMDGQTRPVGAGCEAGADELGVSAPVATAPVVTAPAPIVAEATGPTGATVTYSASAIDNQNRPLATACAPASGSMFALGVTQIVCTATDTAGNTSTATSTVRMQDTTAPTTPATLALTAFQASSVDLAWTASADTVGVTAYAIYLDGAKVATVPGTSATVNGLAWGTHTITVQALDAAGNTSPQATLTIASSWS